MKNLFIILTSLLFILIVIFSVLYYQKVNISEKQLKEYNENIQQGDTELELLSKGYTQALKYYTQAIEIDNSKVYPYTKVFEILLLKRQYSKLDELISKASTKLVYEDKCKLYIQLADAYFNISENKNAINSYVECYDSSKKDYALLKSAQSFIKDGNLSKADEVLDRISKDDINIYSESKLYKAFLKLTDIEQAKTIIDEIDVTGIENEELKTKIGDYKKIVDAKYEDKKYLSTLLANSYTKYGYYHFVVKVLEEHEEGLDEYYDGSVILSNAYYMLKNYEKSVEIVSKVITLEDRYEGYLISARANRMIEESQISIQNYKEAVRVAKGSTKDNIFHEYIHYLVDLNQILLANKEVDTSIKEENKVNLMLLKLYLYEKESKYTQFPSVLESLGKETLSDNEKKELLGYKIKYNLENKKYALVREDLQELIKLDRRNPEYYLLSARLELEDGDTDRAKESLLKSMDFDLHGDTTKLALKFLDRVK